MKLLVIIIFSLSLFTQTWSQSFCPDDTFLSKLGSPGSPEVFYSTTCVFAEIGIVDNAFSLRALELPPSGFSIKVNDGITYNSAFNTMYCENNDFNYAVFQTRENWEGCPNLVPHQWHKLEIVGINSFWINPPWSRDVDGKIVDMILDFYGNILSALWTESGTGLYRNYFVRDTEPEEFAVSVSGPPGGGLYTAYKNSGAVADPYSDAGMTFKWYKIIWVTHPLPGHIELQEVGEGKQHYAYHDGNPLGTNYKCTAIDFYGREASITFQVNSLPAPDNEERNHLNSELEIKKSTTNSNILFQNNPNPFNPTTRIEFSLAESKNVKLEIFNSTGQLVKTLIEGIRSSGYHSVEFDASELSSGIYFYTFTSDSFVQTKKMILLK